MSITDTMRKAFNECTVMAGVEPDFECVYITKDAAVLMLDDIDAAFVEGHERAVEYGRMLGAGTCHISVKDNLAETDGMGDVWLECDECGYSNDDTYHGSEGHFKFCPNCGAKVVNE